METHQMDVDARDAAYRQELHQLVRQQSVPAQKAELKAFLAEFNHFDNFGFDVDIYKRPWIIKKRTPNDPRPIRRSFTSFQGNDSIAKMSGTRRKPWLLRMPIPDPHTGIAVMKTVSTYVTREEAEAVRAEMMKRPATPYQDSTLAKIHEIFLESGEYKGRSDKARELYDLAWKYLKPLWYYKIAALYAQDFQNILDKMADDGLSQSMLEKERTLISKLYRTAIGWRVVDANLASVLKVEGRKSPEREIFTDEQVTLILSQKNNPTGQMVIALLACEVRIYELLHFKHEDFHRTESRQRMREQSLAFDGFLFYPKSTLALRCTSFSIIFKRFGGRL